MRDLDPAILTALLAGSLEERKFYTITAPDFATDTPATAYLWNDLGPITCLVIDGLTGLPVSRTFIGSGTLLSVGAIPLTADLNPRTLTVTLNHTDTRIDTLVRGYNLKNAYCEVHSAIFNPETHELVSAAVCEFTGFVDGCTIRTPVATQAGAIELRVVSHTRETTRAGYQTRSHVDQLQRNATDDMFKYTGIMSTVQIFWGEKHMTPGDAAAAAAADKRNQNLSAVHAILGPR